MQQGGELCSCILLGAADVLRGKALCFHGFCSPYREHGFVGFAPFSAFINGAGTGFVKKIFVQ